MPPTRTCLLSNGSTAIVPMRRGRPVVSTRRPGCPRGAAVGRAVDAVARIRVGREVGFARAAIQRRRRRRVDGERADLERGAARATSARQSCRRRCLRHTPPPAAPIQTRSALRRIARRRRRSAADVGRTGQGPVADERRRGPTCAQRAAVRRHALARDASRIGHETRLRNHAARFLCFETRGAGLPALRFLAVISTARSRRDVCGFRRWTGPELHVATS